jgi:hypothetical protein
MRAELQMKAGALLLAVGFAGWACPALGQSLTDAALRRAIIEQSLASYPGACPCPYTVMRNGRRCGARSAYSRPGGASPVCFEADVTSEMLKRFGGSRSD